jgi:hypothetical protein
MGDLLQTVDPNSVDQTVLGSPTYADIPLQLALRRPGNR